LRLLELLRLRFDNQLYLIGQGQFKPPNQEKSKIFRKILTNVVGCSNYAVYIALFTKNNNDRINTSRFGFRKPCLLGVPESNQVAGGLFFIPKQRISA
jgi:hypothetical protein